MLAALNNAVLPLMDHLGASNAAARAVPLMPVPLTPLLCSRARCDFGEALEVAKAYPKQAFGCTMSVHADTRYSISPLYNTVERPTPDLTVPQMG